MDIDSEIVERNANKTLDIVVPRLAEEYDLELHKPHLSITNYDYMPFSAGCFIPAGKYGVVKLQKESCRLKITCCKTVSHEMGHATIYQNCPTYEKYYDNKKDYDSVELFLMVEEGISQKFEKKGFKILKKEKYLSSLDFYSNNLKNIIFGKIAETLFPDQYSIGEMIIDHYNNKGVSIKKIIIHPEEFKEDLEKNWKSMIKPCSKKVIEFYEKIFQ